MTTLVERPDLSQRTALSKSVLTAFELCETRSWWSLHDPRPFVPNEKVTFGAAVDAGVEVIVKCVSSSQPILLDRAYAAAAEIVERDQVGVIFSDVEDAIEAFGMQVVPKVPLVHAVTQASITAEIEGLGECNGHPDILVDDDCWDVKTAGRAKEVPSLELGFYALLMEAASGKPVANVGYLTWVRLKRPYWQIAQVPVTDELRRWSYEKAAAYIRAKKADGLLNARADTASNYTMAGGPKFDSLCSDCPWSPALGGPCLIAVQREVPDDIVA